MPRTPRIILDENLFFGASDYHVAALSVVNKLRDKYKIEAVYVGQEFENEPCAKRAFKRSNPLYVEKFVDLVTECKERHDADSSNRRAIADFKHCVNEHLSDIDADPLDTKDAKMSGCVPPRGSSDTSIRSWAEINDILIVSCDGGRELESSKTDRILITCPSSGNVMADDIVDRLRSSCYR